MYHFTQWKYICTQYLPLYGKKTMGSFYHHTDFHSPNFSAMMMWTDFQQTLLEDTKMLQKPRFILKKEVGVTVMNLLLTKLKTISNTLINPFSFGHTTFSKLKPFTS